MNFLKFIILASLLVFTIGAQAAPISGQGTWESTLQGRDLDGDLATFEAYYDTALNITWLADANYGSGSSFDIADGYNDNRMTWGNASDWAISLTLGGYTDWRLPTTIDIGNDGYSYSNIYNGVDSGYNITVQSEMSHLFYFTLGNNAWFDTNAITTGCTAPAHCFINTAGFTNTLLTSDGYWSATEYAPDVTYAWFFYTSDGGQFASDKNQFFNAWAIHDGDIGVGVSSVPIPSAVWLFGSGIVGLVGLTRRKKA